jgi:enterochelin esterase family protein
MLIVMPLGYGVPNPSASLAAVMGEPERQFTNYTKALLDEVLPIVEKTYHVAKDRNNRAIAGLSMGGAETFWVGLNNIDKFAYVAGFSSAFVMYPRPAAAPAPAPAPGGGRGQQRIAPETLRAAFPALDAKAAARLKLLYVACGTEDGLIGVNRDFKDFLKSRDVKFTDVETPGAHTWMVWRRNLTEIAPQLFRSSQ